MSGTRNLSISSIRTMAVYITAAILTVISILYVMDVFEAPDAVVAVHLAATVAVYFLSGSLGAIAFIFKTSFRLGKTIGDCVSTIFWRYPSSGWSSRSG